MASNRGLWDGQGTANDAISEPTRRAWLSGDRHRTTVDI